MQKSILLIITLLLVFITNSIKAETNKVIDTEGNWEITYSEIGAGKLCSLVATSDSFETSKAKLDYILSLISKNGEFKIITGLWAELKNRKGRDFYPMIAARATLNGKDIYGKLVGKGDQFLLSDLVMLEKEGIIEITYVFKEWRKQISFDLNQANKLVKRSWDKCQNKIAN